MLMLAYSSIKDTELNQEHQIKSGVYFLYRGVLESTLSEGCLPDPSLKVSNSLIV